MPPETLPHTEAPIGGGKLPPERVDDLFGYTYGKPAEAPPAAKARKPRKGRAKGKAAAGATEPESRAEIPVLPPEPDRSDGYTEFLRSKVAAAPVVGFNAGPADINPKLFPFQRDAVRWACRLGRALLLEECGLGKSFQEIEWARLVCRHSGGDVLILTPLAVARQMASEGEKLGVPVAVCRSAADVRPGVNVTNYESLHKFNAAHFAGVVCDESSIMKSYTGATKRALCEAFAETPYRLAATATPAPNDYLELGNQAQFLGVMDSNEMISRWFINDTMAAGSYRLKGHAEADYWQWVASWAVCLNKPSDLGYSDEGFDLPPLETIRHTVDVDVTEGAAEGELFRVVSMNATNLHKEMRRTAEARAAKVAEIVAAEDDYWVVWCNTNYEADALKRVLPDAVEVRGGEPDAKKEAKLDAFTAGKARVIISKPKIAGFGLNWQHCRNVAFAGVSYSYEQYYQAVRRVWRFGQSRPVRCHVVCASTESEVLGRLAEKESEAARMKAAMAGAMGATSLETVVCRKALREESGDKPLALPHWLRPPAA